ncbi:GTP-binding protein [Streptomyces viridosporus]|uniref:GTP-binding protein n=1 Tax=Streptomyces viridosporus TaxID=67581 RepID=UPI00333457F7
MRPDRHEPEGEPTHSHTPPGRDTARLPRPPGRPLRIGLGGPVGSGKTALVATRCRSLAGELQLAVVTNDIYTSEDADFLLRNGVLPAERVRAVETGCCPHTAIRDDVSANLSHGLIHHQVFVIDVAGGDKVPRKGGPGVTASDLLVINKTDLAGQVNVDLSVTARDAKDKRGDRPVRFLSLVENPAADEATAGVRDRLDNDR